MFLFLLLAVSAVTNYPDVDFDGLRAKLKTWVKQGNPPLDAAKNHGPFIVRLAWHCAGTYRAYDGRGGCDGAMITKLPVMNWKDNAGLPGLIQALAPLKVQYPQMSWGDFIVFVGNQVISDMGGPTIPFCGGRIDMTEKEAQEAAAYFNADRPAGHHDLIYVNPEIDGAAEVRETFANMGFNDQETVAVVGGGHAFGGCHVSRSGFEGFWTAQPQQFTNSYFRMLVDHKNKVDEYKIREVNATGNHVYNNGKGLMMLKTDLALTADDKYYPWVQIYAGDFDQYYKDFAVNWQNLMDRDVGDKPCLGPDFPQIQELRSPAISIPDAKQKIKNILMGYNDKTTVAKVARLVWRCAASFRSTDNRGGCSGFTIVHEPESKWAANAGLSVFGNLLGELRKARIGLSMSDTIVLAGNVAIEILGGPEMPFCHARKDQFDGSKAKFLKENAPMANSTMSVEDVKAGFRLMGLTVDEQVALLYGGESLGLALASFNENRALPVFGGAKGRILTMLVDADTAYKTALDKLNSKNLKTKFGQAWTRIINADRYHGICDPYTKAYIETGTLDVAAETTVAPLEPRKIDESGTVLTNSTAITVVWVLTGILLLVVFVCGVMNYMNYNMMMKSKDLQGGTTLG